MKAPGPAMALPAVARCRVPNILAKGAPAGQKGEQGRSSGGGTGLTALTAALAMQEDPVHTRGC